MQQTTLADDILYAFFVDCKELTLKIVISFLVSFSVYMYNIRYDRLSIFNCLSELMVDVLKVACQKFCTQNY